MTISLSGLNLPFLKNKAPERGRWRYDRNSKKFVTLLEWQRLNGGPSKRSSTPSPYFMPDVKPFVNVAARDTHEITSRSQLREFENQSGFVQVGNDFETGSIAAENEAKKAEWERLSATVEHGWVDSDL